MRVDASTAHSQPASNTAGAVMASDSSSSPPRSSPTSLLSSSSSPSSSSSSRHAAPTSTPSSDASIVVTATPQATDTDCFTSKASSSSHAQEHSPQPSRQHQQRARSSLQQPGSKKRPLENADDGVASPSSASMKRSPSPSTVGSGQRSPKTARTSSKSPSGSASRHFPVSSPRSPTAPEGSNSHARGAQARGNSSSAPQQTSPTRELKASRAASPSGSHKNSPPGSPSSSVSPSRTSRSNARAGQAGDPSGGSSNAPIGAAVPAPTSPNEKQIEQGEMSADPLAPSGGFPALQPDAIADFDGRAASPSSPTSREGGNGSFTEAEPEEVDVLITAGATQTLLRIPQPLLLTSTIARGAYHQCGTARRVKVYELSNETWQDRGTGYCAGVYDEGHDEALLVARMEDECLKIEGASPDPRRQLGKTDPASGDEDEDEFSGPGEKGPWPYHLIVSPTLEAEEILLKTRVVKEDVYQKQQDTLVVWTEPDGTDMALSFQEAEGCHEVWEFIVEVQKHFHLNTSAPPDSFSDPPTPDPGSPQSGEMGASAFGMAGVHLLDASTFALPEPVLGNLEEVEAILKSVATKGPGAREKVAEWIARGDYIRKLCPVFHDAEDIESLDSLHCLCNIMQTIIMLNDSMIIEAVLADDVFLNVVGMLEYDPEFPAEKASYREYFTNTATFKEVVEIEDGKVLTKIHQAYRLQYLKDVILVRVLDDAMFSVLNSWIFFHQFDIVNYCSGNASLLASLYSLCAPDSTAPLERKHDAIYFLHNLCTIGKQIQLPSRIALYKTLAETGLLAVLEHAIFDEKKKVQNSAAEMLTVIIEYDPNSVRNYVLDQVEKKRKTLISSMADLLHTVEDLGLKAQVAESLKTLFDNGTENGPPNASLAAAAAAARTKGDPEQFLHWFYESDVEHLFAPLKQLPKVTALAPDARLDLTPRHRSALLGHLCDLLCYGVIQHTFRSQYFIITSQIATYIGALLFAREKHMQLAAIRFFRACIGSNNQFTNRYFIKVNIFGALLQLTERESRRDNLVLSACLDLFEYLRRETMRPLIEHLARDFGDKLRVLAERPFTAKCFSELLSAAEAAAMSGAHHSMPSLSEQSDSGEGLHAHAQAIEEERRRRDRDLISRGMAVDQLDMDQDAYFNGAEVDLDGETMSAAQTSESNGHSAALGGLRKRKRSDLQTRSLVPYDDFDDSSDSDRDDDDINAQRERQKRTSGPPEQDQHMVDPLLEVGGNADDEEGTVSQPQRSDLAAEGDADKGEDRAREDRASVSDRDRRAMEEDEEEGGFLREKKGSAATSRGGGLAQVKKLTLSLSTSAKKALRSVSSADSKSESRDEVSESEKRNDTPK
ncbi:unnamed protein product [Parajaminaea phylloscopi]